MPSSYIQENAFLNRKSTESIHKQIKIYQKHIRDQKRYSMGLLVHSYEFCFGYKHIVHWGTIGNEGA